MSAELGHFAKVQGGFAFKSKDFGSEGIPVIKIANVTGGGFVDLSSYECIQPDLYPRIGQFLTERDDVLIAMTGANVGKVVRVNHEQPQCAINQRVGRLQIKAHCEYSKDFFYYLTSSPAGYQHFVGAAYGSAQPNISGALIERLQVPDISPASANQAASFLRQIDDKIHLNHQINQTLEQMAHAIFKSWFVDFEPVKAKIAALEAGGSEEDALLAAMQAISAKDEIELARLQAEQPEQYAELRATAELFPSAMQDSELGEIPEGWNLSTIGDEVTVVGGGTPSTKNPDFWDDGQISWTSPKDLSSLPDKVLVKTERKITEAGLAKISSGLLPVDTVLMSSRAPVGYLALAKIPLAVNQGYIAMKCEKVLTPTFVIQWCQAHMDEIKNRASGTTFAEISKKNFNVIPVAVPTEPLISIYSRHVSSLYETIETNVRQSGALADLRDFLLPKLLSGELSVSAEDYVAEKVETVDV